MADDVNETLRARQSTHGDFNEFASVCQRLKDVLHGHSMWPHSLTATQREALDMIVRKIARVMCGNPNERDHWHDIAGYATLVERSIPVPPPTPAAEHASCSTCGYGPNGPFNDPTRCEGCGGVDKYHAHPKSVKAEREKCPRCGVDDAHRLSNDGKCYLCRKPL